MRKNELEIITLLSGMLRKYNNEVSSLEDIPSLIESTANEILDLTEKTK